MKIEKFENIKENNYNYKYGGYCFVLARYKGGWNNFPHHISFYNDEFVPCMISGNPTEVWQSYDFFIVGETGSYNIDKFDIIKDSDKGFDDFIKMLSSTHKFNI